MTRPTNRVGQQPYFWLLFPLYLRKRFRLRYLFILFIFLILLTYLRIILHAPSDQIIDSIQNSIPIPNDITIHPYPSYNQCNYDETERILNYPSSNIHYTNDGRPKPTIERLYKLFRILISHEEKNRQLFDYLNIFRFTDLFHTLRPFANDTQRLATIYCLFQRYITIDQTGHLEIKSDLIFYLKQISTYLSDGFRKEHSTWKNLSGEKIPKPVIILAANSHFYETLQASMKTVNTHLKDHSVAIYDLGFTSHQLEMIKENCERCVVIPFPFDQVTPVASHVKNLGYFTWKPIVIQDALRRFGSIIYGDTSVRYHTSNFDRLLIDNQIRGFACRELPGHYLPCFTLGGTFTWFNETYSSYDDIYIAEAGFVAVTDNFLSRLILKSWVTCALDTSCIAPHKSRTHCRGIAASSNMHRFDQSAMVAVLSFYFFPSARQDEKSEPAPYDMYASIQAAIAEVRRFEGDKGYFTRRNNQKKM